MSHLPKNTLWTGNRMISSRGLPYRVVSISETTHQAPDCTCCAPDLPLGPGQLGLVGSSGSESRDPRGPVLGIHGVAVVHDDVNGEAKVHVVDLLEPVPWAWGGLQLGQ